MSRGLRHLLIGTSCAIVTSAVIGFGAAAHAHGGTLAIAVWPLLLTLGVMEWQIHSFRGRGDCGAVDDHGSGAIRPGRPASLSDLLRYLRRACWRTSPPWPSSSARFATPSCCPCCWRPKVVLGVAFFLGMILQSSTRPDITLHAWAVSLTALAIALRGHSRPGWAGDPGHGAGRVHGCGRPGVPHSGGQSPAGRVVSSELSVARPSAAAAALLAAGPASSTGRADGVHPGRHRAAWR